MNLVVIGCQSAQYGGHATYTLQVKLQHILSTTCISCRKSLATKIFTMVITLKLYLQSIDMQHKLGYFSKFFHQHYCQIMHLSFIFVTNLATIFLRTNYLVDCFNQIHTRLTIIRFATNFTKVLKMRISNRFLTVLFSVLYYLCIQLSTAVRAHL